MNTFKCFLLFLGDYSPNHMAAIKDVLHMEVVGFKFIPLNNNFQLFLNQVINELDNLKQNNIEPIIMKGFNIHTEDYIRTIIKYYKRDHVESFLLTHCAVFDSFILSDAALLTNYTSTTLTSAIDNAVNLKEKLSGALFPKITEKTNTVALLNAGGSTNLNTASENWKNICKTLETYYSKLIKNYSSIILEIDQLDSCLDSTIRTQKNNNIAVSLPAIIIPSSINEGNSIWKALTVVGKQSLAGIVTGIPMYIGLTSRTDSAETIKKTLTCLIDMFLREKEKEKYKDVNEENK